MTDTHGRAKINMDRFAAEVLEMPQPDRPERQDHDKLDALHHDVQTVLRQQQIGAAIERVGEADIGRLSGEAVMGLYEVAAKAIETMGTEMKERIKGLESALVEADDAMKAVVELAAIIREKGKLHEVRIEEATVLSKEIRDACAEFRKKVVA